MGRMPGTRATGNTMLNFDAIEVTVSPNVCVVRAMS